MAMRQAGTRNEYPWGSKLFMRANYSLNQYVSLVTEASALGAGYLASVQPLACRSMSAAVRKGKAAFEAGIDYLPDVPLYGNADDTAGFVFGNNAVIGVMQIKQERYRTSKCPREVTVQYRQNNCLSTEIDQGDTTNASTPNSPIFKFQPGQLSPITPRRNISCASREIQETMASEFRETMRNERDRALAERAGSSEPTASNKDEDGGDGSGGSGGSGGNASSSSTNASNRRLQQLSGGRRRKLLGEEDEDFNREDGGDDAGGEASAASSATPSGTTSATGTTSSDRSSTSSSPSSTNTASTPSDTSPSSSDTSSESVSGTTAPASADTTTSTNAATTPTGDTSSTDNTAGSTTAAAGTSSSGNGATASSPDDSTAATTSTTTTATDDGTGQTTTAAAAPTDSSATSGDDTTTTVTTTTTTSSSSSSAVAVCSEAVKSDCCGDGFCAGHMGETQGNCVADCSSFDSSANPWEIAQAGVSDTARLADNVLGADDPDAGKSFEQMQLERRTQGVGLDPFCYNYVEKANVFYADLGYYSFPRQAIACNIATLKKEKWLDHQTKSVELRVLLFNVSGATYVRRGGHALQGGDGEQVVH